MKTIYHKTVLLHEAVEGLNINPKGIYVDVTFGGGGHSKEILSFLSVNGKLFAFDQDEEAFTNQFDDSRFQLIKGNFSEVKRYLKFYGVTKIDGIIADFGVSSHQLDSAKRGFSTRFDGPLDMRMSNSSQFDASKLVNEYSMEDLIAVLTQYERT